MKRYNFWLTAISIFAITILHGTAFLVSDCYAQQSKQLISRAANEKSFSDDNSNSSKINNVLDHALNLSNKPEANGVESKNGEIILLPK